MAHEETMKCQPSIDRAGSTRRLQQLSAFTLIELLIVIAIIAVLAGLLFAVFARAREKGKQAVCESNLRQIGIAALLYEQDYDDHYPLGHTPLVDPLTTFDGGGDYEPHFIELIRPFIKNSRNNGIWRCPSDPQPLFDTYKCDKNTTTEFRVSYSVNAWFEYGAPLSAVDSPSTKVYVLESTGDDHFHWWAMGRTSQTDPFPPIDQLPLGVLTEQVAQTRDSGGSNFLYADGHVKWGRFSALWGTTHDTSAFWP